MYFYVGTVLLCVLVMKGLQLAYGYLRVLEVSRKVPMFPLNHPVWGILHVATELDSFFNLIIPYVQKSRVKMFQVWVYFFFPIYAAVHPDSMKQVLKASHPKNKGINGPYRMFMPWIGDGLLVSDGKKWERNRRLLTPAFHYDILKPYVTEYNAVGNILVQQITKAMATASSIDICPYISRATLDTMLRCTLSFTGKVQEEGASNKYVQSVNRLTELVDQRSFNPLVYLDFVYNKTKGGKEFKKLCDYVHGFSGDIISRRKMALDQDPSQLQGKRRLDFLDILLTAKDESGRGLTDQEIRDEVDTFLFEGHDTTASALMWALYAFAKYPAEQDKVRSEVENLLAGRNQLECEDIPNLRNLSSFLKESMRMYSTVPAMSRMTVETCVIEGVTFPAGTQIDLYPHVLNRHPDVWTKPNVFSPDRFLRDNRTDSDPFAYIPFSAGSRNCIGQLFAKNELKILLSKMVTRFRIMADKDKEPVPYPSIVMRAKSGIYLTFVPL